VTEPTPKLCYNALCPIRFGEICRSQRGPQAARYIGTPGSRDAVLSRQALQRLELQHPECATAHQPWVGPRQVCEQRAI